MKYFIATILGIAVLGGVWFLGREPAQPAMTPEVSAGEEEEVQRGPTATINGHMLELEVMRTPEEQGRGLSGREELAENEGMLFVFDRPRIPGFWMKDMNFSIDIIWIAEDKKIVGIENNVAPATFPELFRPPSPTMYVLEVNATWAKDHGVTVGDEVIFNGVF